MNIVQFFRAECPHVPAATMALAAVCIIMFVFPVLGIISQSELVWWYGMKPSSLFNDRDIFVATRHFPPELTLFTHAFFHANVTHLVNNAIFFLFFGSLVENKLGHTRFIIFFLLCSAFSVFMLAVSKIGGVNPLIGASGAIFGLMGATVRFFPKYRIMTGFVIFYFLSQFLGLFFHSASTTAWVVHLTGFLFGVGLAPFFAVLGQKSEGPFA
ncbi:rhomboid family intramembrane serine protease [bacterium]|nr:rhomboid family intramembrane serine protease [bacterium]